MSLEAAMQSTAAEVGNGPPQVPQHIVERQQGLPPEGHDNGFPPTGVNTELLAAALGPIGASAVVARLRHLRTVFGFSRP
jgi:hypothetical protein